MKQKIINWFKSAWMWFFWTFIKSKPKVTTKHIVIQDDTELLREYYRRKHQQEVNARYMRRYSGKNKFVKTGRNGKN